MVANHEVFMRRALDLALRGLGKVSPNPLVGAVLVHEGKIISEGYHSCFGGPHAEVNALQGIDHEPTLEQSTLYVSLEPCNHFGKTPPCTSLIIKKRIPRVVIACEDPNPIVAGKGIQTLKEAGIEIVKGVLEKEAKEVNRRFWVNQLEQRPYLILKWAETTDGFVAERDHMPIKISSELSDRLSHRWRTEEDALLVGRKTVESDNPSLTARHLTGRHPAVVIIDPYLKLTPGYRLFNAQRKVFIINHRKELHLEQLHYLLVPDHADFLQLAMHRLYKEAGTGSIIIEGGPNTLNRFIHSNLFDEFKIIRSIQKIGTGLPAPFLPKGNFQQVKWGTDEILFGKRH